MNIFSSARKRGEETKDSNTIDVRTSPSRPNEHRAEKESLAASSKKKKRELSEGGEKDSLLPRAGRKPGGTCTSATISREKVITKEKNTDVEKPASNLNIDRGGYAVKKDTRTRLLRRRPKKRLLSDNEIEGERSMKEKRELAKASPLAPHRIALQRRKYLPPSPTLKQRVDQTSKRKHAKRSVDQK